MATKKASAEENSVDDDHFSHLPLTFFFVNVKDHQILHVMIRMLSSHLMQSEMIIYGLSRKCVKLSPFS